MPFGILRGQYYPYYNTHSIIKRNTAKVQRIAWSGGSVEFTYGLARTDYLNDNALTKITVKNPSGTIIKEVQLNYTYFQSDDNCQAEDCKRLKLDALTESNGGITKTTSFDYYHENQLSRRKSLQKDYLGYFNKNGVDYLLDEINLSDSNPLGPRLFFYPYQGKNSILPFERKDITANYREIPGYSLAPNENSLIGLLKKVTYPAGGSVELSSWKPHLLLQRKQLCSRRRAVKNTDHRRWSKQQKNHPLPLRWPRRKFIGKNQCHSCLWFSE